MAAWPATGPLHVTELKGQLQTELDVSRRVSTRNCSETAGGLHYCHGIEIHVVEDVEEVSLEAQVESLGHLEMLGQGKVVGFEAGALNGSDACVAVRPRGR